MISLGLLTIWNSHFLYLVAFKSSSTLGEFHTFSSSKTLKGAVFLNKDTFFRVTGMELAHIPTFLLWPWGKKMDWLTSKRPSTNCQDITFAISRHMIQMKVWFSAVHTHLCLGGCPNPSKVEQCWKCTFLNLYTHGKTKLASKKFSTFGLQR